MSSTIRIESNKEDLEKCCFNGVMYGKLYWNQLKKNGERNRGRKERKFLRHLLQSGEEKYDGEICSIYLYANRNDLTEKEV